MKSSALVGLIAGAIAGIIPFVIGQIGEWFSWPYSGLELIIVLINQALIHIGLNAIWGAVFGIFFALVYDPIPYKGIRKGLFIGLIYWLFSAIRPASFLAAYGDLWWATGFTFGGTLDKFVYGILFAILYKK